MAELNYFDLGAAAVILLLGLKGLFNGFFKELFGMLGIIGGIYVGSRFAEQSGTFLSDKLFHFDNHAVIIFTGFLSTLALFWIAMALIGGAFARLSTLSGLGSMDKILGFVLATSKIFLILSVTVYALGNIKIIQNSLEEVMNNSVLYPVLKQTGEMVVRIDPSALTGNTSIDGPQSPLNKKIDETVEAVKQQISIEHTPKPTAQETIIHE